MELGDTVACTITIHHLELTVDDWAGCCHCYCKPVAKFPNDRKALQDAVKSGSKKVFLGTDSAPHNKSKKEGPSSAAGVYTGHRVLEYLAHALDSFGALDQLKGFATVNGRLFYGLDVDVDLVSGKERSMVTLVEKELKVEDFIEYIDEFGVKQMIVPFKAGKMLKYSVL